MAVVPVLEPIGELSLKRLLVPLSQVVGFGVAFGLCVVMDQFVRAFFGTLEGAVGWVPFLNRVAARPIHRIEADATHIIGGWANGLEQRMGDALHQLAALIHALGAAVENSPMLLHALAKYIQTFLSIDQWRKAYQSIVGVERAHLGAIRAQTRVGHANTKAVAHAGKVAAEAHRTAIAIPGQVAREWDIPRIRERVKAIENGAVDTWRWIRSHPGTVATGAFAGAVAFALGRLGAGWIRCTNVRRLGRRACGMDANLLESLLADTMLVVGTLSLVTFAEEMQGVTETAVRPITSFWRAS